MKAIDWLSVSAAMNEAGYAILRGLLNPDCCAELKRLYNDSGVVYRSTIDMNRYNFGRGEYKYFAYPLPDRIALLRTTLYPPLAEIANEWNKSLGRDEIWPSSLDELINLCKQAGQNRPTPLLLKYGHGDFNCLHQDLYGEIYFPLQLVVMLSDPLKDFTGGELTLVEQRPRMQSRPIVVSLKQGDAAIIPVRERPRQGKQGFHRVQMRHGVSEVRSGERKTLGIIFHDAK